jgi:YjbR protein
MTSPRKVELMFERLTSRFLTDPAVSEGTGFGSKPGLRVKGKIFAMLVNGELVLKLPRERVDQLVASGSGSRFDPRHGRVMKEWVTVPLGKGRLWDRLADEALQFVGAEAGR